MSTVDDRKIVEYLISQDPTLINKFVNDLPAEWAIASQLAAYYRQGRPIGNLIEAATEALKDQFEEALGTHPAWKWLATSLANLSPGMVLDLPRSITEFLTFLKQLISYVNLPGTIKRALAVALLGLRNATMTIARLTKVALEMLGVIFFENDFFAQYSEIILNLFAALFPELRTKPKAVWAPIFKHASGNLDKMDRLGLTAPLMEPVLADNLQEAIRFQVDLLNRMKPEGSSAAPLTDEMRNFFRGVGLPPVHRGTRAEWEGVNQPDVELLETPELTARVQRYLEMGGHLGLDGVYTGAGDRIRDSVSRYVPPPVTTTAADKFMIQRVTDALVAKYPEAFARPRMTSPEAVWKYLEKKYSPGLPFIGRYRQRRELEEVGWKDAIIKATYHLIETGRYPPQVYHAFMKSQVVDKEKLERRVRTVVAQDLLSYMVDQVFAIERNKRDLWSRLDTGIGLPMTQGAMLPLFRRVAQHKYIIEGDFTDYDANAPAYTFEALNRLAELGLTKDPHPYMNLGISAFNSKYKALQNANILILSTGEWVKKSRGGGTGQSATSWDNTIGVKILFLTAWADLTGRDPLEFFSENDFANTGDDNIWGCSTPGFPIEKVADYFKRKWKMELKIKLSDDIFGLTYLSKHVVRLTPEMEEDMVEVGQTNVDLALLHDRTSLLTKRSAYTAYNSGLPPVKFQLYLLQRTIGHIMLTAFQPDVYDVLAREYIEDATQLLRNRPNVRFTTESKRGLIRSVSISVDNPTPFQAQMLKKIVKLPTYLGILRLYLQAPTLESKDRIRKIRSVDNLARAIAPNFITTIWRAREFIQGEVATALLRLNAEPDLPAMPLPFKASTFDVERFIWMTAAQRNLPSMGLLLRSSPFTSSTDLATFEKKLDDIAWVESWDNRHYWWVEDGLRLRMFAAMCFYFLINWAIFRANTHPVLWLFSNLFVIFYFEMQRVYSFCNGIHWLATGRSSNVISSMIRPDQHSGMKTVGLALASLIPLELGMLFPLSVVARQIATWVELAVLVFTSTDRLLRPAIVDFSTRNDWREFTQSITAGELKTGNRTVAVTSGTATGKSSFFMAALLETLRDEGKGRVVLFATPRIALRDSMSLEPAAPNTLKQVLRAGINKSRLAEIFVCTPGHAVGRILAKEFTPENTVIIQDEIHLQDPEQIHLFYQVYGVFPQIVMTATLRLVLLPPIPARASGLNDRFERSKHLLKPESIEAAFVKVETMHPAANILVILPSIPEVVSLYTQLKSSGRQVTQWYKGLPMPSGAGVTVATQIAEVGVDFREPVDVVIDSGIMVRRTLDGFFRGPVDVGTAEQRAGRVARKRQGFAYRVDHGLTDREFVPMPNPEALLNSPIRDRLLQVYNFKRHLKPLADHVPGLIYFRRLEDGASTYEKAVSNLLFLLGFHYRGQALSNGLTLILGARPPKEGEPAIRAWIEKAMGRLPEIPSHSEAITIFRRSLFEAERSDGTITRGKFCTIEGADFSLIQ